MSQFVEYFTEHRWQRRVVTLLVSLVITAVLLWIAYPHVQDYLLLRRLGSADKLLRHAAIEQAAFLARQQGHTAKFLNDSLQTESDLQFEAVASALARAKYFFISSRHGDDIDRYRMLQIQSTHWPAKQAAAAETRYALLRGLLLDGRQNAYVKRAAVMASTDEWAENRVIAAVLAAGFEDDALLGKLISDADGTVASAACLCAALAGRSGLTGQIAQVFEQAAIEAASPRATSQSVSQPTTSTATQPYSTPLPDHLEVLSAAAYALAKMDPAKYGPQIARQAMAAKDNDLRERLLSLMPMLSKDVALPVVQQALSAEQTIDISPAALVAAAKLGDSSATQAAARVLKLVVKPGQGVPVSLVRAAMQAAGNSPSALHQEIRNYCLKLWGPQEEVSLIAAARLLGQASLTQSPLPPDEVELFEKMVYWVGSPGPVLTDTTPVLTTPVPSAAAAVAMWLVNAPDAQEAVKDAAASEAHLAAQYIAWHASRIDQARAFELGLTMLPPSDSPISQREDRNHVRICGALMLALSARGQEQVRQAVDRIRPHVEMESDFYTRGACRSALLILGQPDQLQHVKNLLDSEAYPLRETLTALTFARDRLALDSLLWNLDDEDLSYVLVNHGLLDVLNCVQNLPRIDACSYGDILNWQMRIVRLAYGIGRSAPVNLE